MKFLLSRVFFLTFLGFIFLTTQAQSDATWNRKFTRDKFATEIDTLYHRIQQKHPEPFWKFSASEYETFYQKLKSEIYKNFPISGTVEDALPYFEKLISYTGDIHTSAYLLDGYGQTRLFPFYVKKFHTEKDDAYYAMTVDSLYSGIIGLQLEKISNINISEVINRIESFLPPESNHSNYYLLRLALRNATFLHSIGITNDSKIASFTFSNKSGITVTKQIPSNYFDEGLSKWIWYDDLMKTLPLTKKNRLQNYWFEYFPKKQVVYFRFKQVANNKNESFFDFTKRLLAYLDSVKPNKLIIDIRDNVGGNNFLTHPLICGLINNKNINQYGKLFCLTNQLTFSAAISFLGQLDAKLDVITMGEPPADAPNFCSDIIEDSLPYSHLYYGLSSFKWINTYAYDPRKVYMPDEPVQDFTWAAYNNADDEILKKAIDFESPQAEKNQTIKRIDITGKYRYSPLKPAFITQRGSSYYFDVPGELITKLCYKGNNLYSTGLSGLQLKIENKNSITLLCNEESRGLNKIPASDLLPYEELAKGNFEKSVLVYKEMQSKGLLYLQPNNLSTESFQIYLFNKDKNVMENYIKMNKELNPKEKFSEYIRNLVDLYNSFIKK